MSITFLQGLGIVFVISGAILSVGLNWLGIWAISVGIILILLGLYLARKIFDKNFTDESRFFHNNNQSDD
jgi:uncharacterized protein YneF (UPF0154 family)